MPGSPSAAEMIPHSNPLTATAGETFDVGVDTRPSLDDRDHQPLFRFDGTIGKLTFKLIRPVMTAAEEKQLQEATRKARNAAQ